MKPPPGRSATTAYDRTVAESYARLAEPRVFRAPARDLVALLALSTGDTVLDVGCGTGPASVRAAELVGTRGRVVALDASPAMLRILAAQAAPRCSPVAGVIPGLPCGDGRFSAVMAGFVLSHVPDPAAALADAARVLRPGGRLGVSAWAAYNNPFGEAWGDVGREFVPREAVERPLRELLPYEERFAEGANLRAALEEAGFRATTLERREYPMAFTLAEFLELREHGIEGQLLLGMLTDERRAAWRERLARELGRRFGDRVEYVRPAHLATGRKA